MKLKQLAILLLVILLSFVFKMAEVRRYDTQLIFILLVLLVLVANKAMCWLCKCASLISSEGYQDFAAEVNEFLGRDLPADASQSDVRKYNEHLAKLGEKIDTMNTYLAEIRQHQTQPVGSSNGGAIDELNIQASQQIQDYRIRNMESEIQRTTDLIKKSRLEQDSAKYKKIPVYSSCIIANADGSISVSEPNTSSSQSSGVPSSGIVNEPGQSDSTDNGMGATATNGTTAANGSTSSGATSTSGSVQDLLQAVLSKGIKVNLTS